MPTLRALLAAAALLAWVSPAAAATQRDYNDCQQLADIDRRIAGCTRVIDDRKESASNRAIAFANRCGGLVLKGEYTRAVSDCDSAIRLNPKSSLGYHNRALAWQAQGDRDRAIADYDQAIRLDPKSALSFEMRGVNLTVRGDNDRALADFNEAIRLNPGRANTYLDRSVIWARRRDTDRAIADLSEAIRLDPNYTDAYARRARLFRDKEDHVRVIADLSRVMELRGKPTFEDFIARAISYRLSGNPAAALDDVKRAGEGYPDMRKASYFYQLGWNLELLGRTDEAIEAMTAAIADDQSLYWAYFRRGVAYEKKGEREKALADLTKAADNLDATNWNEEAKAVFARHKLESPSGLPIGVKDLAGYYDLYNLRRFRSGRELSSPAARMVIVAGEGNKFQAASPSDVVKPENAWEGTGTLQGKDGSYTWKFRDGKTGRTDFVVTADNDIVGYVQISDPARQDSFNWWYIAKKRKEAGK
ncbi:MAG: tetratricopeptide repeat protein [Pseudolabrys sp.]